MVNNLFVFSSYLLDLISPSKIKTILYSDKEWWDQLLQKGPLASRFKLTFSKFENCNFFNYDMVIPLTIPDLEICIDRREQMVNSMIPVPSQESFMICNDKRLFNDFMLSHNYSDYVPGELMVEQFPFMLKKIMDECGENTFIIESKHDLEMRKEQYDSIEYFTQNIIPGKNEYATHVLIKDGKIVSALTIVYVFKTNCYVKGKDHYICRMVTRNRHLDLFENILKTMKYDGLCCVNYKVQNGVPKIFEINPRFGGSLCEFFYPFIRKVA